MDYRKLFKPYLDSGLLSGLDAEDDDCLGWFCRSLSSVDFPSDDDAIPILLELEREHYRCYIAREARYSLDYWPETFIDHLSKLDKTLVDPAKSELVVVAVKRNKPNAKHILLCINTVFGERPKFVRRAWLQLLSSWFHTRQVAPILTGLLLIINSEPTPKWQEWTEWERAQGRNVSDEQSEEVRWLAEQTDAQILALKTDSQTQLRQIEEERARARQGDVTINELRQELAASQAKVQGLSNLEEVARLSAACVGKLEAELRERNELQWGDSPPRPDVAQVDALRMDLRLEAEALRAELSTKDILLRAQYAAFEAEKATLRTQMLSQTSHLKTQLETAQKEKTDAQTQLRRVSLGVHVPVPPPPRAA